MAMWSRLGTPTETAASSVGDEVEAEAAAAGGAQRMEASLARKVRAGAGWAAGSTLLLRFANIALMAVVARIVAPEEFGVFALALTVQAMLVSLAELGVASAVARSDLDPDEIAPTVATISVIASLSLAAAMAVFATPLAVALGSASAAEPLRIMSLSVALIGPLAVPGAQLQREFRQRRVFLANAIAFIPSSAVLLVLAVHGDGAVAFAWSRVIGQAVMGAVMILSLSKHYLLGFNRAQLAPLLRFGVPLALANLLSQVLLNVDYVFVGRMMNIDDVGLYMLAFNIAAWSTAVIGSMLNSVVLPAFSRVSRQPGPLADALRQGTRAVALVASPIGALTLALASPLITTVYGPQWSASAPVLRVLAVYGVISVACLLFANIIVAMGRTGVLLWVQIAALVCLVPALWLGVRLNGLVGVGLAHICVILVITLPAYLVGIRRSTGSGPGLLARAVAWPVAAAAVAGGVAWSVALVPERALTQLLVGGVCGGLVYVVLTAPLLVALVPGRFVRFELVSAAVKRRSRSRIAAHHRTRT